MSEAPHLTELINQAAQGDRQAGERAYALIEGELRRFAAARLRREQPGHSLQTTAIVDDVWLRLVGKVNVESRRHFFVLAARSIRRMLIDRYKARCRRLEGRLQPAPFDADHAEPVVDVDLEALGEALERLQAFDLRMAQVVELRYIIGYTIAETAEILECSPNTVKNDWATARAWLKRELSDP